MIVAIVSAISSVLGFLYSKDGMRSQVSGIGFLLLMLIVSINGLNILNALRSDYKAQSSAEENERLRAENRQVQSYLSMTTLQLEKPLDFGVFFLSSYSENYYRNFLSSPDSTRFVGMLPIPAKEGLFGRMELDIPELITRHFEFTLNGDTSLSVEETSWDESDEKKSTIVLRSADGQVGNPIFCNSEDEQECAKEIAARSVDLVLEFLAAADGDTHLSVESLPSSDQLAGVILSKLLQTQVVGYLRLAPEAFDGLGVTPKELAHLMSENVVSGFRFSQPQPDPVLAKQCNRVIKLAVGLREVPEERRSWYECGKSDLCVEFFHEGNLQITPCELSQF